MAVEKKRGCGYRKVGGTYLVSSGEGMPCDRIPIRLDVCPVCSHGFKQSRGWTWVDLCGLIGGEHEECECWVACPLCKNPKKIGKAGLLWIGEKFYKTPQDFSREGRDMGFCKRIHAVPRHFKVGETWILLAHPKVIRDDEIVITELGTAETREKWFPGIFTLWRPTKIEKILKESQRNSEEVDSLLERGITPVFVPDDDKDHQGSAYDKEEEAILDLSDDIGLHDHTCQQCGKLIVRDCECDKGDTVNMWCSANCKAAYDL